MAHSVKVPPGLVGGEVDEGYGKVADAFRRNLSSGQEVGAAFAEAYRMLNNRITVFLNLPLASIDRRSLGAAARG